MADENENKPWTQGFDQQAAQIARDQALDRAKPKPTTPEATENEGNENNNGEEEDETDEAYQQYPGNIGGDEMSEVSQENSLSAQMAEKGADMAKQVAKKVAKEAVKKAAMSAAASIASAVAAFLAATIEIWLPAIIIIFCAAITYQYWQKHSWDQTLYWNAARGNFAELLNNAINDIPAYDTAPAPKADAAAPKAGGGARAK